MSNTNQEAEVYNLFISGSHETAYALFLSLESCANPEMSFESFYVGMMKMKERKREIEMMHSNSMDTLGA